MHIVHVSVFICNSKTENGFTDTYRLIFNSKTPIFLFFYFSMNNEIVKKLREHFENQGITQRQIAKELNVSFQYINNMFSGTRNFGRKTAQKFQKVYGISSAWLMTGEGEMFKPNMPKAVIANNSKLLLAELIATLKMQIAEKDELIATQSAIINEMKELINSNKNIAN